MKYVFLLGNWFGCQNRSNFLSKKTTKKKKNESKHYCESNTIHILRFTKNLKYILHTYFNIYIKSNIYWHS